ncbi:uncharacterized protein METZ01_LOCUS354201, partial [marine metagenome]
MIAYIFFLEVVPNPDKIFFIDQGFRRRESTSSDALVITWYNPLGSTLVPASLVKGLHANP